jgi:hypothetical protein
MDMFAYMNGVASLQTKGVNITRHLLGARVKNQSDEVFTISGGSMTSTIINQFYQHDLAKMKATVVTQCDLGKHEGDLMKEFGTQSDTEAIEQFLDDAPFEEDPGKVRIKIYEGYTQVDIDDYIKFDYADGLESEDEEEDEEVASAADLVEEVEEDGGDNDGEEAEAEAKAAEPEPEVEKQIPAIPRLFYFSFTCAKRDRAMYKDKLVEYASKNNTFVAFNVKDNLMFVSNVKNCTKYPPRIAFIPGLKGKLRISKRTAAALAAKFAEDPLAAKKINQATLDKQLAMAISPEERKEMQRQLMKEKIKSTVPNDARVLSLVSQAINNNNFPLMKKAATMAESAALLDTLKNEVILGSGRGAITKQLLARARESEEGRLEFADLKSLIEYLNSEFGEMGDFNIPENLFIVIKKQNGYFKQIKDIGIRYEG